MRSFLIVLKLCLLFQVSFLQSRSQNSKSDTVTLFFGFNKDTCLNQTIQKQIFQYDKYLGKIQTISIFGFTDTIGTIEYNINLAKRRVASVNAMLIGLIPLHSVDKIITRPMGEDLSLNTNNEEKRRVDILFSYKVDSQDPRGLPVETTVSKIIDTVIQLERIYFKPDLPILSGGSFAALSSMLPGLKRYQSNFIEVRGHVNHTDSKLKESDPLFQLSIKRARVIYDYLVENGFNADRLKYIGLGNSQLVFDKPLNESQKRVNMRVELVVFKKPIDR